jgi:hypothetical protein
MRIEPQFGWASFFREVAPRESSLEQWRWAGYIDARGRMVIEPKFLQGLDVCEGIAASLEHGEPWSYIDDQGEPRPNNAG